MLRYDEDVNGSLGNVAGVINERGNVMGLMPHPSTPSTRCSVPPTGGLLEASSTRQAQHSLART